jgi:hypothetical protein
MNKTTINDRLDSLIIEGERLWQEFQGNKDGMIMDIVGFTQWATSCLNLLDKLSITTNRFVSQFEIWVNGGPGKKMNIGAALGVLKSARDEFNAGLAIEYHLSISATVFNGILDEAEYLCEKNYLRAGAVLIGAALEEALKSRAKSNGIELAAKETLTPIIHKLKDKTVGILSEFDAKRLDAVTKMRNDAAHGGDFNYNVNDMNASLIITREIIEKILTHK